MNNEGKFKAEWNFKHGHLQALEKKLHEKLSNCDKLARPHIKSRLRTLKTNLQTIHEMLTGQYCSGFGWDPDTKTVTVDKMLWDKYLTVIKYLIYTNLSSCIITNKFKI